MAGLRWLSTAALSIPSLPSSPRTPRSLTLRAGGCSDPLITQQASQVPALGWALGARAGSDPSVSQGPSQGQGWYVANTAAEGEPRGGTLNVAWGQRGLHRDIMFDLNLEG